MDEMDIKEGMPSPYSYGRLHLPEDDSTFAPPALSAYSIALLSDNTSNPSSVTGIDTLQLKVNPELRSSLKSKLSVHFQNSDHSDSAVTNSHSNPNTSSHNLSGHNLSSHNLSSYNVSGNNISNVNASSNNLSSNNLSAHSTSGHSMNQNTSNTSFSSSSNMHQEDDLMDVSGDNLAKSLHSSSTTPGGSVSLVSLMSRPHSNGYSGVKRSRLARRFTTLGPPKRASEMPEPMEEPVKHEPIPDSPVEFANDEAGQNSRPKRLLSVSPVLGTSSVSKTKSTVTSSSDFFKTLELLKKKSPNLEFLSHTSRLDENFPSSHESKRAFDATPSHYSNYSNTSIRNHQDLPTQRQLLSRPPLQTISPNHLNIDKASGDFRKPRTPKSQSIEYTPLVSSFKPRSPPSQAVRPNSSSSFNSLSNDAFQDEAKRRKIIHINSQQYEKLELLGRGGTSKVYKVRSLTTKLTFAIKKVSFDKFDEACVKGFKGEIDLLTKLKDESRVVKLVDHAMSEGSIFLVMECGDLDLARVLQTKLNLENKLDFSFVKFHSMEILKCVEAVHRAGIVHSDLKPANFLFVKGVMKIIDFGIANAVPDHTANIYRESQIGTPNYMAPEALVEVNHTLSFSNKSSSGSNTWKVGKPSDIWSCGCIIYQMIYGRPPYGSYSGQLRIMAIMNPQIKIEYPSRGVGGVPVPHSSIELMQKCLARNPNERWTVEECINCDFLKPKAVSRAFVKDLVYSAVNFGCQNKEGEITDDVYEKLVETVLHQIEDLNYA